MGKQEKAKDDISVILGRNILTLREKKFPSQKALAKEIGVSRQQIGQYERGEDTPGKDKLPLLASALGVTIADLYSDKPPEKITSVPKPEVRELPHPVEVTKSYAPDLIEALKRENKALRKENKKLRAELEAVFRAKVKA